jgi:hypothetical protein
MIKYLIYFIFVTKMCFAAEKKGLTPSVDSSSASEISSVESLDKYVKSLSIFKRKNKRSFQGFFSPALISLLKARQDSEKSRKEFQQLALESDSDDFEEYDESFSDSEDEYEKVELVPEGAFVSQISRSSWLRVGKALAERK